MIKVLNPCAVSSVKYLIHFLNWILIGNTVVDDNTKNLSQIAKKKK